MPATKRSVFNVPTGPDHIVLYQKNIEAVCSSEAEVRHKLIGNLPWNAEMAKYQRCYAATLSERPCAQLT